MNSCSRSELECAPVPLFWMAADPAAGCAFVDLLSSPLTIPVSSGAERRAPARLGVEASTANRALPLGDALSPPPLSWARTATRTCHVVNVRHPLRDGPVKRFQSALSQASNKCAQTVLFTFKPVEQMALAVEYQHHRVHLHPVLFLKSAIIQHNGKCHVRL